MSSIRIPMMVRKIVLNRSNLLVNTVALAIGFAAAIIIAIYIYNQFSYEEFIPDYHQVVRIGTSLEVPGQSAIRTDTVSPDMAAVALAEANLVALGARLIPRQHSVRNGAFETTEEIYWADPSIFRVIELKAIRGDLKVALDSPDGIVLTQSAAEKYFGKAEAVGQQLEIDRKYPMRVTAIIEDIPDNSHLDIEMIGSGRASFSFLAQMDSMTGAQPWVAFLYLKILPGVDPSSISSALDNYIEQVRRQRNAAGRGRTFSTVRIEDIHLQPEPTTGSRMRSRTNATVLAAIAGVGALLVIVSALNFVNLMTAATIQRRAEVGVKKAVGATRRQIALTFILEMLMNAAAAMLLAICLLVLFTVFAKSALAWNIAWDYFRDPRFYIGIALSAGLIGVLGALYPMLALSWRRPADLLRDLAPTRGGKAALRNSFVAIQFMLAISLVLAAVTMHRQMELATSQGLSLDPADVLVINSGCKDALVEEIGKLPNVMAIACAGEAPFSNGIAHPFVLPGGGEFQLFQSAIDFDFFDTLGISLVAGRQFERTRAGDMTEGNDATPNPGVILNETAVRRLELGTAENAVGKSVRWSRLISPATAKFAPIGESEIVGVVADFPIGSIERVVEPTIFYVDRTLGRRVLVKTSAKELPTILKQVDQLWTRYGEDRPIDRFTLLQFLQQQYSATIDAVRALTVFTVMAFLVAGIGLAGLAAQSAEVRSKEMAIRKVLGANDRRVLALMISSMARPIVVGSLVSWAIVYLLMQRWLNGYAYRVDLNVLIFPVITIGAALVMLLATVPIVARVSRQKPMIALRQE